MYLYRRLAACALGLGLIAALLVAPVRAADVDKLLPNDTEIVAGINVKQILNSPLAKKVGQDKIRDLIKQQDMLQKVLDDLGFDPFKDLDTILAAWPNLSDTDKGLIIIRGNFDIKKAKEKAQALAKDQKDVIKPVTKADGLGGKHEFWEVTVPDVNQTAFVSLFSKDTILIAPDTEFLVNAIEQHNGTKKVALKNKEMAGLISRLDTKQSLYVGVVGNALGKSPLAEQEKAKEIIDKVSDGSIGLNIDKDITLEVGVQAKGTKDAEDLEDVIKDGLNQALGLAALFGGGNKQLAPLIDILKTIKPKTKDKTVTVKATVDSETLDGLIPKQ
jgi:hypothetical protein